MKKNKLKILCVLIGLIIFLPAFSWAADSTSTRYEYKLLEGLPGFYSANESPTFNAYISAIYKFGIWTVGIAALLMISIGAFMYLTSAGNNAAMGNAKSVIADAIIGLILALLAWLLLYTINPELISPKGISETSSSTSSSTASTGTTTTPTTTTPTTSEGTYSHQEAVDYLKANGIATVSSRGCLGKNETGCTTLEGMPKSTLETIVKIKNESGVNIQLSGGAETEGHSSHGPGKGVADIQVVNSGDATTLTNYLKDNRSSLGITKIYSTSGITDNASVSEKYGVYHIVTKT